MIEKSKSYSAKVIREAKDPTYLKKLYGEVDKNVQLDRKESDVHWTYSEEEG